MVNDEAHTENENRGENIVYREIGEKREKREREREKREREKREREKRERDIGFVSTNR